MAFDPPTFRPRRPSIEVKPLRVGTLKDKQFERERGSSAARGYGSAWRKARIVYLSLNPLCVGCLQNGISTSANVVDHVTPHRGDAQLFWDQNNWQSLCASCHNRKTLSGL